LLERLLSEHLIHIRKSELHHLVMRSRAGLSLLPFRLFQGQKPLGLGEPPQVSLRAAEVGLEVMRALHLLDVLVIRLKGYRVL
jgi:hypothetical protein